MCGGGPASTALGDSFCAWLREGLGITCERKSLVLLDAHNRGEVSECPALKPGEWRDGKLQQVWAELDLSPPLWTAGMAKQ